MLLDYFAIEENQRGKGLGSESLGTLQKYYEGRKFFLEIESVYEKCENLEERKRRKQFYLQNGMTELKIMVNLFGTNMEVLGYRCKLDFKTYHSVYEYSYGKCILKNIRKKAYPV